MLPVLATTVPAAGGPFPAEAAPWPPPVADGVLLVPSFGLALEEPLAGGALMAELLVAAPPAGVID